MYIDVVLHVCLSVCVAVVLHVCVYVCCVCCSQVDPGWCQMPRRRHWVPLVTSQTMTEELSLKPTVCPSLCTL